MRTGLRITVVWTLALLLLGSVVHATESSLACPDWPTCFGTLTPQMKGGVFWEHLHRLVAGGLILVFGVTAYLTWKRTVPGSWIRYGGVAGIALLLVQSVFGGLTVLMRLPDAISTTHLALAFSFLALVTAMATVTSPGWDASCSNVSTRGLLRRGGTLAAILVFGQSVLGAAVRHTDAGLVCPDVPLCLGQWIPPLGSGLVALHFAHRALGILTALATVTVATLLLRREASPSLRRMSLGAILLVLLQISLGFASVHWVLAPALVSLHTLAGALLLAAWVSMASRGWEGRSAG